MLVEPGSKEHVEAMLHWSFQRLPEVVELQNLLHNGLICPVEFSQSILTLWASHSGEKQS